MGNDSTGAPVDEQDDFDKHFAALSDERRGSGQPAANGGADSTATTQAAASTAADEPGAQVPGAKDEAAGQGDGGKPAAAAQPASTSEIDQLRAELQQVKTELGQALHRERSVAGRISSADSRSSQLQRENADLKRQVADLQKQLQNRPAAQPGAAKDILSETPDLEAAIKSRIDAATATLQQALDAANTRLTELGEAAQNTQQATRQAGAAPAQDSDQLTDADMQIITELDKSFTQAWRRDVATPEFVRWLKDQPAAVQTAYDNGATVKDTSMVLELFYAARGNRPRPQAQASTTTPPANAGANKPATPDQDRLRRSAGLAPRSPGAPKTGPADDDFEGHFEAAARERASRGNAMRI